MPQQPPLHPAGRLRPAPGSRPPPAQHRQVPEREGAGRGARWAGRRPDIPQPQPRPHLHHDQRPQRRGAAAAAAAAGQTRGCAASDAEGADPEPAGQREPGQADQHVRHLRPGQRHPHPAREKVRGDRVL